MDESLGPLLYQKLLKNEKSINYSSGLKIKYFESNKLIRFLLETNPIFGKNKISVQWMEALINFSAISNIISKKEVIKLFIEKQKYAYEINRLKLKKYHPY